MAYPTAVNDQITDSVTQSNVETLASAPAQAMGALYTPVSHSLGLASANAVAAQQNTNILMQAVTTRSVAYLLGSAEPPAVAAAPK